MGMNHSSSTISWSEPRWSCTARIEDELRRSGLWSPWLYVRLGVVSIVLIALTVLAWSRWASMVPVPWLRVLLAPLMIVGMVAIQIAISWLFPTRITLQSRRLILEHASERTVLPIERVVEISLQTSGDDRRWLTLEYVTPRGRLRVRRVGLAGHVDPFALAEAWAGSLRIQDRDDQP